jgi:hypothetical protein
MNRTFNTILYFSATLASASAAETIDGGWTVQYVSGIEYKTIGGAEFIFHPDGNKLTGIANVGFGWPGRAPISEGKIDGDRVDFLVYGQQWSSSGYPEMHFVGAVNGDKIQISMLRFLHGQQDGDAVIVFEGRRAQNGEVKIAPLLGTFMAGRYHHDRTGTEFTLPAEWMLGGQAPSSGGGDQVHFRSDALHMQAFVWLKPQTPPAARIPYALDSEMQSKAAQRTNFAGFRMLPATFEHRTVAGQPAVSVESEYFDKDVPMTEYHTWIMSEKTHVYISARVPAAKFADAKSQIESCLTTFLVP